MKKKNTLNMVKVNKNSILQPVPKFKFVRLLRSWAVAFKFTSWPDERADALTQPPTSVPVASVRFKVTGTLMPLSAVALTATVPGGQVVGGAVVAVDEGVVAPPLWENI